jgi:hypothetical protein
MITDRTIGLASLELDNAIRLRWALRDIHASRTSWTPVAPVDLRVLMDMGYIETKDDTHVITLTGMDQMNLGD